MVTRCKHGAGTLKSLSIKASTHDPSCEQGLSRPVFVMVGALEVGLV